MSANRLLRRRRHRHHACLGYLRALKALIDRKARNIRIALCQTALHDTLILRDALICNRPILQCLRKQLDRWCLPRRRIRRPRAIGPGRRRVVRPVRLRTHALLMDAHDAVADLGARVRGNAALDFALVVVDEEARGHEVGEALLEQLELEGRSNGVCGAGADLPLVVHGGAVGAQVGARRQVVDYGLGGREHKIARIGQVGLPAISRDAADWSPGKGMLVVGFLVVVVRHCEGSGGDWC